MSDVYQQYLSNHYAHVASPASLERKKNWVLSNHRSRLPVDRDAAILEIGPGFGNILQLLRDRCGYTNIRAIDVSPEVITACNDVVPNSTSLVEDTVAYLQAHEEKFDLVLLLHVLEHVPRDGVLPLLAAIRSALKPKGRLVLEVPNAANPLTGANMRYADFTHHVGFTDRSLEFVMLNAGFADICVYPCKVPRESVIRTIQRAGQDSVEMLLGFVLRLYMPTKPSILTSILGACGTK